MTDPMEPAVANEFRERPLSALKMKNSAPPYDDSKAAEFLERDADRRVEMGMRRYDMITKK